MRKNQFVKWAVVALLCTSGAVARKDEVAMAKCTRVQSECKEDRCEQKEEGKCPTSQGWGSSKNQNVRGAARKVVEGKTTSNVEVKSAARKSIEAEYKQ